MKDLRDWLQEADPAVTEPPLSDADVQRMRRVVVAAGDSPRPSFGEWTRGAWAVATIVVAVTIAVSISRWDTRSEGDRGVNAGAALAVDAPAPVARRQVQLITPGGTRVIWIFNEDFRP
jgi:hypothetical protein